MPDHYTDGSTDGPAHYTDRTADPLADALDEISTCLRNAVTPPAGATPAAMQSQHDQLLALRDVYAPALLAAVSKVLELHTRQKVSRRWWDWVCDRHRREGWPLDDMIACADCKHRDVFFCSYTGCEEVWPCATAEAIERELTGLRLPRGHPASGHGTDRDASEGRHRCLGS